MLLQELDDRLRPQEPLGRAGDGLAVDEDDERRHRGNLEPLQKREVLARVDQSDRGVSRAGDVARIGSIAPQFGQPSV